jgi:hypothetical protein
MKRRRQIPTRREKASQMNTSSSAAWLSAPRIMIVLLLMLQRENSCLALLPSISRHVQSPYSRGTVPSRKGGWATIVSPLFSGTARRMQLERRRRQQEYVSQSSSSATALPMVLTTPESIIEQASTVNLLDDLIDESVRTSPRRPIMMQFDPSSGWIWRRWKGTIFSETWTSCVKNMVYATMIFFIFKQYPGIKDHLNGFGTLWGQLLSVTTFTLTFFVNQSYALWRKCYELSRRLQGRLHDIGMNLATHATRKVPTTSEETSTYTAASRQILELMSRYIRLFDLLTYASFTRSHRPVLTPRGMRRLVERGLMTAQERQVLVDAAIPATQRHSAILMWMMRLFIEGRASGHILGGDGFEQQTMEKFHIIRAQYGAIGDELQGRMPLAYAHVVQILVDLILWMYPAMAFSISMSPIVAIVGTGLLTLSYQGLFDLAKQFLDPYDNENYGKGEDPLSVDTLIAETNAGSVRWMYGFEEMPFSQDKVKDGDLYDYLLPVRGYSLEELAQMEEEKLQRDKEFVEEQRIRQEQESIQREVEKAKAAEEEAAEEEADEALGDNDAVDDNYSESVAAEEQETSPVAADRPMHKITTLADGTVVSFKEEPEILSVVPMEIASDAKPVSPAPAVPNGAAPYLASLSGEKRASLVEVKKSKSPVSVRETNLVDYDGLQELPFLEEVAPIEEEALSQILADEEVKDATEVVAMSLNREEYETKIAESKENPQIEVLEATEISVPPVYDNVILSADGETKLQEKSDAMDKRLEQVQSSTMSELEAVESPGESSVLPDGSEGTMIIDSMGDQGISEFQSTSVDDRTMDTPSRTSEGLDDETPVNAENKAEDEAPDDGPGSKEEPKPPTRLTLDDYNEQVEKIMEAAKEELLETEAILKARPGADPLGWDYDDEQLAPSTTEEEEEEKKEKKEKQEKLQEQVEKDEYLDLDVLEMDMSDVDAGGVYLKAETAVDDTGETHAERDPETPSEEETIVMDSNEQPDVLGATNQVDDEHEVAVEEDNLDAKATDRIEPIFLDGDVDGDVDDDEGETEEGAAQDQNNEADDDSEYRL